MKKDEKNQKNKRKLMLHRETLRPLEEGELEVVMGGDLTDGYPCRSRATVCRTR